MVGGKLVSTEREVPKADDHFTDREQPRESFAIFFDRLYRSKIKGETGEEKPLLNFYGVGGVGKSTLLRRAQKEFRSRYQHQTDFSQFAIANLDLTALELGNEIPSHVLLWKLRNALLHSNVRTTLFDCIYLHIWQTDHPGQQLELPKTASQNMADAGLNGLAAITGCQGALAAAKVLWQKAKDRKSFRHIQSLLGGRLPEDCKRDELDEKLPLFLADDIISAFESNPLLRVALCIDEYEQIQERHPRERSAEAQLLTFLGEIITNPTTRDRFGVVIMGRERLTWDRVYQDPDWQNYIESHILSGLSEKDARSFLIERIVPWLNAHNETAAANSLIKYLDPILDLTRSGPEGSAEGCLPLHLDLIVLVARNAGEEFTPELLANPNEQRERIEERFLRYLKRSDSKRLDALQILAYTPAFDRSLFDYLIENKVILDYRPSDFAMVLGGEGDLTDSFVRQHPTWPGHYVLHRQMQTSLVNSTLNSSFGTSGIKERLQLLVQFYINQSQFDTPANATELHHRMVALGFEVIRIGLAHRLMTADVCKVDIDHLLKSFDSNMALKLLSPIWAWLAQQLEQQLGPVHPDTTLVLNNLVDSLKKQADYAEVRKLREKMLADSEQLCGINHPNTLLAMENLADALDSFEAKKPIYEKALAARERLQGIEHPDTLRVMNGLALCFNQIGDLAEVAKFRDFIRATADRLLNTGHRDNFNALDELSMTLNYLGDDEGAKVLQEQVLLARERSLGAEDPDTIRAMEKFARTLLNTHSNSAQAQVLQEKILMARERNLGAGHPDTLSAMQALLINLCNQGDVMEAKVLLEKGLEAAVKSLGSDHPVVLNAIENIAKELALECFDTSIWEIENPAEPTGAKALLKAITADRVQSRNAGHLMMSKAMEKFANALALEFDDEAQRTTQKQDLEDVELRMGTDHPHTLAMMESLCLGLEVDKDFEGIRVLQEKILAARERSLGPEHPATLSAMHALARTLTKLGDFAGVKPLQEKMLFESRRRLAGRESSTWENTKNMESLGRTLANLGNFESATLLQEEVLAVYERQIRAARPDGEWLFDDEYSFTLEDYLTARESLAESMSKIGNLVRAKRLLDGVIEAWEQLGDPARSLQTMICLANVLHNLGDFDGSKALNERIARKNHA